MITRDQLVEMFDSCRSNPSVTWNIDGRCRWEYNFLDHDGHRLESLSKALEQRGYTSLGIDRLDDEGNLRLQVYRDETHSVDSLHTRNLELYALADGAGIAAYDGMEVGPVAVRGS